MIFISGNMPMKTEIAPLLIVTKLEQYDYAGATAIALVMLAASFVAAAGRSTSLQALAVAAAATAQACRNPRGRASHDRAARPSPRGSAGR